MSINLVQWEGSTVTPKLDAIMYDDGSYGIIKGCAITHQGTNLLKIANGFIKIAGRLIEIAEETIQCQVSASGTVNGQLWLRLDLSSVTPAVFMTEAAAVLTPLTQNADCNFQNGIYELQLATYNIDESVITNLVETAPELERLRTALENIDLDASNVTYRSTTVEAELDDINDNLAQTPITKGGVTLSTIDDKLNYLIEGAPNLIKEVITTVGSYSNSRYDAITVNNFNDNTTKAGRGYITSLTTEYVSLTKRTGNWVIQVVKPCYITFKKATSQDDVISEDIVSQQNYTVGDYVTDGVWSDYTVMLTLLIEEPRT